MYNKLNVKKLRTILKKSQTDFCNQFGQNQSSWSYYESTNNFPESLLHEIEATYSSDIKYFGNKVFDQSIDTSTVETLRKRITELEELLRQKDSIINNLAQVIEMQNQTYLALKQSIKKQ